MPIIDAIFPLAKEAYQKNNDLRAVIRADTAVQHGRVIRVLDDEAHVLAHVRDRLGDLEDVVGGRVDPDEERDLDVGADVVGADQAVLATARDVDGLDRQIHDLGLVHDRQHDRAGERDLGLGAHLVHDHRVALLDLAPGPRDQHEDAEHDDRADADQDHCHLLTHMTPWGWAAARPR